MYRKVDIFFAFTDCPSMFHQYDDLIDMLVWDDYKRLASVFVRAKFQACDGGGSVLLDSILPSGKSKYVHVDIIWVNEVTLIASEMTRRCHYSIYHDRIPFKSLHGHMKGSWCKKDRTRVRQTGNDLEFRHHEKTKGCLWWWGRQVLNDTNCSSIRICPDKDFLSLLSLIFEW